MCENREEEITSYMQPAPIPNEDTLDSEQDRLVADPLADSTLALWEGTAERNRAIFADLFHCVPSNVVRNWEAYDVSQQVLSFQLAHIDASATSLSRNTYRRSERDTFFQISLSRLSKSSCRRSGVPSLLALSYVWLFNLWFQINVSFRTLSLKTEV